VVHVRVGEKNGVDGREIVDVDARAALTAQQDEARGEDGIDEQSAACGLDEEGRVPDEGDGSFAGSDGRRSARFAAKRLGVALAYGLPDAAEVTNQK